MHPNEARKHNTKRQLLKCLSHLRIANRQLYLAEDHSQLCCNHNTLAKNVHTNLDALRAGAEETTKFIAQAIQEIELSMETPSAIPPPIRGSHLERKQRLTPYQRSLAKTGVKFPSTLPTYQHSPPPAKIPQIIKFSPSTKTKQKPRTQKKDGIIPI